MIYCDVDLLSHTHPQMHRTRIVPGTLCTRYVAFFFCFISFAVCICCRCCYFLLFGFCVIGDFWYLYNWPYFARVVCNWYTGNLYFLQSVCFATGISGTWCVLQLLSFAFSISCTWHLLHLVYFCKWYFLQLVSFAINIHCICYLLPLVPFAIIMFPMCFLSVGIANIFSVWYAGNPKNNNPTIQELATKTNKQRFPRFQDSITTHVPIVDKK